MREVLKHENWNWENWIRWVLSKWPFLLFPICAVRKIVPHGQLASIYCRHIGGRVASPHLPVCPLSAVEKIKGVYLKCFEDLR